MIHLQFRYISIVCSERGLAIKHKLDQTHRILSLEVRGSAGTQTTPLCPLSTIKYIHEYLAEPSCCSGTSTSMQASASLSAIHTRRLHGRSTSSQASTSSLPDFDSHPILSPDPASNNQLAINHSARRPFKFDTSGGGSTLPIRGAWKNATQSSSSTPFYTSTWLYRSWNRWRVLFALYLLFSLFCFTRDLYVGMMRSHSDKGTCGSAPFITRNTGSR